MPSAIPRLSAKPWTWAAADHARGHVPQAGGDGHQVARGDPRPHFPRARTRAYQKPRLSVQRLPSAIPRLSAKPWTWAAADHARGSAPRPGVMGPKSPATTLARTSLVRARARIRSPDRVSSASHPRSRVQAQNPGPGPAPTMPGGRSPRPGVWDPSRPRVPGSHKGLNLQRLRENRAVRFPDRRYFYNGLGRPGLGIVRLSARRGNLPETPPKWARKLHEQGAASTRSLGDQVPAARAECRP